MFTNEHERRVATDYSLSFTLLYSTLFLIHQSSALFPESARLTQKVSADESAIQALSLLPLIL